MTKIIYGSCDDRFIFEAEGHAVAEEPENSVYGCGQSGQDGSVCAAVSILVLTLVQCLEELEKLGYVHHLYTSVSNGYASIEVSASSASGGHKAEEAFSVIMSGMSLLQEHYPELIEIE